MAIPARSRVLDLDDPKFVRRFTWTIWRRGNVGALVATITGSIVAGLSAPVYLKDIPKDRLIPFFLIFAPPAYMFGTAVAAWITKRFVRNATLWVKEEREPSAVEIGRLTRLPRTSALCVFALWTALVPMLVVVFTKWVGVQWPAVSLQASFLVLTYAGVQGAVLGYLLNERAVRPVLAKVLPADTSKWPKTIGMTTRLLTAWFVVSAAPLLLIAFNIGRLDAAQRAVAGPSIVIACFIIIAIGFVVFGIAGQAITAPLEKIRLGMQRVASGDLSIKATADEAGEIGLLQAGLIQMVEGLRERERMRETFGRLVGHEVAQRAMAADFGLGGERCEATALFVDIIGSTGLAQSKDPDEVVAILNTFFDMIVRTVGAEGGMVNKFQGDGAMCVFGAPTACDDHAARGLRTAYALARELATLDGVGAAIGISSGEVVAGNVGSADRYEFTVIGDPVNEASRLCDEAKLKPSHVLASERTIRAGVQEARNWLRGETIILRGRREPTSTYEPRITIASPSLSLPSA